MPDEPPVSQLLEIAASGEPLHRRAHAVVETLAAWLPADALWLSVSDPASTTHATVGSMGLTTSVLEHLGGTAVAREVGRAGLNGDRPPAGLRGLPLWRDCLGPAGFADGLGVPLYERGGLFVGLLGVLQRDERPPSTDVRRELGVIAPLVARSVSPVRSLLDGARLVTDARAGLVLFRDGSVADLPGLEDHELLTPESPTVTIGRDMLLSGQAFRSFLWPTGDDEHCGMTVLAARDAPDFILGTLLVTSSPDCHGLTNRELEVLGLIVDGRSNQEIAHRLGVAMRTVATHVEHILHKLQVPSRTLAAVQADREGWHVPWRAVARP